MTGASIPAATPVAPPGRLAGVEHERAQAALRRAPADRQPDHARADDDYA